MTTIFLSYSRGDDEPFVKQLYEDLSQRGFDLWFDRVSMPSRQLKFLQEIRDAIATRERLLLVIGPKARTSEYVTQEWKNALEMGKCVNPIVRLNGYHDDGGTIDGYDLMPEELKLIHTEDFRDDSRYAEHLANLIRQLSDPAPPLGKLVAVPTLPLHYLAQRDRLLKLRDALLTDLQRPVVVTGAAARVGVQGMGGIGKSVLAAALARDLEVRRAFPDGIFWIGVGQRSNLVELQRFIARELGDEALFNDLHAGKQKLKELLAERAALLILDDVWQSMDANAFDVLGPRCKLLLTTRDAGLVSTMAGTGYQVQLPTEAEALVLLANAARVPVESLPPLAAGIVAECGRLPLALALCGGMAAKGHLWERILRALREARLELIADRHEIEEHHRSIWRAMEVSVQALPPDEQRRFAELAVFATDAAIPEAAVLTLWSHTARLDELAAADLLVAFNERSLVQLDHSAGAGGSVRVRVSLHDLLHDFATRLAAQLLGKLAALHNQLLDAYRKQCPNGWPSGPNDGYFFQHLRDHLVGTGRSDELVGLLLDINWFEAKNENGLTFDLPLDFAEAQRVVRGQHPQRHHLPLLEEALRRDIHFIARHSQDYPQALFQCLWNSCWWYDSPEAVDHYQPLESGGPVVIPSWSRSTPKLSSVMEEWRAAKEKRTPSFQWVRSLRPPSLSVGGSQRAVFQGPGWTCVAYSPDGLRVASGARDGTIHVWDQTTGRQTAVCDYSEVMDRDFFAHPPSAEGEAAGFLLKLMRGLNAATGGAAERIQRHVREQMGLEIKSVAFFPDGRRIVSGTLDATVRVWDAVSGKELQCFRGHKHGVTSVAVSSDGERIASTAAGERAIRVWNARTGSEIARFDAQTARARCVSLSPKGYLLAAGYSDGSVRLWDLTQEIELSCLSGHADEVQSIAFTTDGQRIVSGSNDKTIRVWDLVTRLCETCIRGHEKSVTGVAWSPDGQSIVSSSWDRSVRVWDAHTGAHRVCFAGHVKPVLGVAFSPSGHLVASASEDNTLRIWSLDDQVFVGALRGHTAAITEVAIKEEGKAILSGARDGAIREWNPETGTECSAPTINEIPVEKFRCTPDGTKLICALDKGGVAIWDGLWRRLLLPSEANQNAIIVLAVSADSRFAASGSQGGTVVVWDLATGAEVARLRKGASSIFCLAFLPNDRNQLVVGWQDGTLRVWNIGDGGLDELIDYPNPFGGSAVANVAVSPKGDRIVSVGYDNLVRFWDYTNGIEVAQGSHQNTVFRVAYSTDGLRVATWSRDCEIRVWDPNSGTCIEAFDGLTDIQAVADGPQCFPWRAVQYPQETLIQRSTTGETIAWFERSVSELVALPRRQTWTGHDGGTYLYLFTLEGTGE